ncbi:protein BatD [bacterium]|nr:protein BatD [bacterium]
MKINVKHGLIVLFLFVSITCFGQSTKPGLKAWVEPTVVGLNQSFTLYIELSGKDSRQVQPELPAIDSWAIFLGSGSSQNMQIINGSMSISKIIHYQFQTRKEGRFTIPAVKAVMGGKTYTTQSISIKVDKNAAPAAPAGNNRRDQQRDRRTPVEITPEDLFVKVTTNRKIVYVNEPIVVTYTIYTRVSVSSYEFIKMPTTSGFWAEELNQNRRPKTRNEVVDGQRYTAATIKKTMLFPMSAGIKNLEPMSLKCAVKVQNRSRNIFDDFFNDSSIKHSISSKPLKITVKPLPLDKQPSEFNGLVGQYSVKATVDKRNVQTNQAVTYKLTVAGAGNLQGLATPSPAFPDAFEVYPPEVKESVKPAGDVLSGSKTYEWVLVPRSAGHHSIPPVELVYFNPRLKKYERKSSAEISLQIARGQGGLADDGPALRSRQAVALLGHDIRYIKTEGVHLESMSQKFPSWIYLYFILLPIFLVIPAWYVRRHQDRLIGDVAFARRRRAGRLAKKHLTKAKLLIQTDTQKNFYAEVGRAITGFIGDKLNMPTAGMMSEEIQRALLDKNVSAGIVENIMQLLAKCDMMRFAPTASDETEMDKFFIDAETALNRLDREISR